MHHLCEPTVHIFCGVCEHSYNTPPKRKKLQKRKRGEKKGDGTKDIKIVFETFTLCGQLLSAQMIKFKDALEKGPFTQKVKQNHFSVD